MNASSKFALYNLYLALPPLPCKGESNSNQKIITIQLEYFCHIFYFVRINWSLKVYVSNAHLSSQVNKQSTDKTKENFHAIDHQSYDHFFYEYHQNFLSTGSSELQTYFNSPI